MEGEEGRNASGHPRQLQDHQLQHQPERQKDQGGSSMTMAPWGSPFTRGRSGSNAWDFEEDHLLSYFLDQHGSNDSMQELSTVADASSAGDALAMAAAAAGRQGKINIPAHGSDPSHISAPPFPGQGQPLPWQTQAQPLSAMTAQTANDPTSSTTSVPQGCGSGSGSVSFEGSGGMAAGMRPHGGPGTGPQGSTLPVVPSPILKPSSMGSLRSMSQTSMSTNTSQNSPGLGASLHVPVSASDHNKIRFVIGDEGMGGSSGETSGGRPTPSHVGVSPPPTPTVQFYGSGTSSSSAAPASSSPTARSDTAPMIQPYLHYVAGKPRRTISRVPSRASVTSTSPSSSVTLETLGATVANEGEGDAIMEVHRTLQMRAAAAPQAVISKSPIVAQQMMAGGLPAAASQLLQPGSPPLGSPEKNMLPPPPRFPPGAAGQLYPQTQAISHIAYQQQQQLQHHQFLQHMSYAAQIGLAPPSIQALSVLPGQSQQSQPQPQIQPLVSSSDHASALGTSEDPPVAVASSTSSRKSGGKPKRLPPLPSVASEDIVKAAATAGIINPNLVNGPHTTSSGRSVESADKRAKRLARNRESARKSRRMKKELLQTLSAKVNMLHDDMEEERRQCMEVMEGTLSKSRQTMIENLLSSADIDRMMGDEEQEQALRERVAFIVKNAGPNCTTRVAVANFQYDNLEAQLLPRYRRFILWLSSRHPKFYSTGKDQRSKMASAGKATGRMSSKQVGEECFTTQKQKLKKEGTIRTIPQSLADDAGQMWPLFCYDMSISVDQEDKIAQLCKTCYDSDSLPSDRNETATANSVSRSLKHGVLYHGHASAHRHQTALLEVLTQEQSARFLRWFEANKDRCEHILGSETRRKEGSKFDTGNICADMKEASLDVLCQQLKDALKLRGTQDDPLDPSR